MGKDVLDVMPAKPVEFGAASRRAGLGVRAPATRGAAVLATGVPNVTVGVGVGVGVGMNAV
jgi:hypothetical protein